MTSTQLSFLPYLEHQSASRPEGFIPVYEPVLDEAAERYVLDAVHSGWISSLGKYVGRFEALFAEFCGVKHAVSVSNGTTALHLILHALGIGPGDEVIVPSLSFVASANAVHYTGATPVFVDVDAEMWTLDPADVERKISPRTRSIMPVHLYGHPADMDAINAIVSKHGLAEHDIYVVEDAAEAHGAAVNGKRTGSLGTAGAFSFFANKVVTTGEGGMVTTDDEKLAARARMLRDHAMPPDKRYWHDEVGFNYRLTNLQAAVGVAQMARIDEFIARKRAIAALYNTLLADVPGIVRPVERPGFTNIYWMYSIVLDEDYPLAQDELIPALRERGIDSRPFFHPLDTLPPYRADDPCPTALDLSRRGLNLPSSPSLTDSQVAYICEVIGELA